MINRLSTLYELQLIDDQLDELEELRGDLPLAVNLLKNRLEDIQNNIESKETEKEESMQQRISNEEEIERHNKGLKKFKSQLYQVRNNKEYDALTKEIDHAEESVEKLELENIALEELAEKIKVELEEITPQLETLNEELKEKESELKKIIKSNEREEIKLKENRENVAGKIRKSDLNTYIRVRKACSGKAIVTISRSACTGCHNVVPPQRQLEIRQNKRLYTCENCGRLLISPHIADDVKSEFKI